MCHSRSKRSLQLRLKGGRITGFSTEASTGLVARQDEMALMKRADTVFVLDGFEVLLKRSCLTKPFSFIAGAGAG